MGKLKWFSGGQERREQAIIIIDNLIGDIEDNRNTESLQSLLLAYREEFKNSGTSTPYILNRMNLDMSRVLLENGIKLSDSQSSQLKSLRSLSAIRII